MPMDRYNRARQAALDSAAGLENYLNAGDTKGGIELLRRMEQKIAQMDICKGQPAPNLGKFVDFDILPQDPHRKTRIWEVRAVSNGALLGQVRWYGPWRCYAFYPLAGSTLFESVCLHDLAHFCQVVTQQHMMLASSRAIADAKTYLRNRK